VARQPSNFYRFAAGCSFFYVLVQTFQEVVFHFEPEQSLGTEASVLLRLNGSDQARAFVMLISFFGLLAVFSAVALSSFKQNPGPTILGLVAGILWVFSELFYRTTDFFLVTKTWATEYQRASAGNQQASIAGQIHRWDQFVWSWYFVLLIAYLIASIAFGFATNGARRRDKIMSFLFFVNGLTLAGRLLEEYPGQTWLTPVNAAFYFPTVVLLFGFLGFCLITGPPGQIGSDREGAIRT
jgi:hypothetical protein